MARIVALTGCFPRHREDAAGAHIAAWARALASRGHELRICVPFDRNEIGTTWHEPNIEVLQVGPRWLSGHLWYGAGAPDNLRRSRRAWLEAPLSLGYFAQAANELLRDADLLWSHWVVPFGVIGTAVAQLRGVPHVAQIHGSDLAMLESVPAGGAILRTLASKASRLLCVSREQRTRAERLVRRNSGSWDCEVLALGVERPPEAGRPVSFGEERPTALVLSRLVASKGVDLVIRAMAGLASPARLLVVGDGPERAALARLAATLGVDATFAGACSPAGRWQYFETADLFVHAAKGIGHPPEGCPVVIGEAQAAGVPVVATRVGGTEDSVGAGGLLVDPDDVSALTVAISRVLFEPDLAAALRAKGREHVESRLWPNLAPAYDAVIADAMT